MTRFLFIPLCILIALPAFAAERQPGDIVAFREVCQIPDPLKQMSDIQQERGLAAGQSIWQSAIASDVCISLPVSVPGTLVEKLGTWHSVYQLTLYRWSLWSVEYHGTIIYGLFAEAPDHVSMDWPIHHQPAPRG